MIRFLSGLGVLVILSTPAFAQETPPQPMPLVQDDVTASSIDEEFEEAEGRMSVSIVEKARIQGADLTVAGLGPLLFLKDEYDLLVDAKRQFTTRAPNPGEIDRVDQYTDEVIDPGRRELILAGIVYKSAKDWTIWFNEQRVTPNAIPEEVLDIKVFKDYIDVKWFDEYTNQIFPIRLRPHQRFNLDSRIFLPGSDQSL